MRLIVRAYANADSSPLNAKPESHQIAGIALLGAAVVAVVVVRTRSPRTSPLSPMMSSKQTALETTIQADVAPGDETGIYYITICNLPFESSWQELKDWLRQVCIVDHIELFRKSTSGWIRLRGRDDFEKAWKYINSVDFNGRYIIASDRNRTESIKIKELVETSLLAKDGRLPYSNPRHPYHDMISTSLQRQCESQLARPQYSTAPFAPLYSTHAYPPCAPALSYPTINHVPGVGDAYTAAVIANSWTPYGYGSPPDMVFMDNSASFERIPFVMYPTSCNNMYSDMYDSSGNGNNDDISNRLAAISANSDYITTEPLKILITSISQRANPEETVTWIRRKTGPYAGEIMHIDVPSQNAKRNRVRGHAYVIFRTTAAAHGAVQLLHQAPFQNRKISARFTVEGVTAGERASPPAASRRDARRDLGEPPASPAGASDSRADGRQRLEECEASECCARGAKAKQDRTEEGARGADKESRVRHVIADGSSRRLLDKNKA